MQYQQTTTVLVVEDEILITTGYSSSVKYTSSWNNESFEG